MTVLITGGTGFVGLNLTRTLRDQGYDTVVLHRNPSSARHLPDDVEAVTGDILHPDSYAEAVEEADAVVHLAALLGGRPEKTWTVNVEGTATLAKQCANAGVETFVFASTIRAHPYVPVEPSGPYEQSKVEAEKRLLELEPSFDWSIVYPTVIFGPRDRGLTRYEHFRIVESNPVLVPPLYLHRSYNVVHVGEVVEAICDAIEGRGTRRTVVSGRNRTAVALHRSIAKVVDSDCLVLPIPETLTNRTIVPMIDLLYERGASPVRGNVFTGQRDAGTVPKAFENQKPAGNYGFEATLQDTYDWYRSVGLL